MSYATGGRRPRIPLREVSLEIDAGELIGVWGPRSSGRTTLLRIAAGIVPPTAGSARFAGVDLARRSMLGKPNGIAYATTHFEPAIAGSVLAHVAAPLLGRGFSLLRAQTIAYQLLRRAHVAACATSPTAELDDLETFRVAVARALVTAPSLLLVDQAGDGPPPAHRRDELLKLLHSLAHYDEIAVMLTTDEPSGLAGVDRALALDRGRLRGTCSTARVIPLRRR